MEQRLTGLQKRGIPDAAIIEIMKFVPHVKKKFLEWIHGEKQRFHVSVS